MCANEGDYELVCVITSESRFSRLRRKKRERREREIIQAKRTHVQACHRYPRECRVPVVVVDTYAECCLVCVVDSLRKGCCGILSGGGEESGTGELSKVGRTQQKRRMEEGTVYLES